MEQQAHQDPKATSGGGNNSGTGSGFMCRQSSTRWTPTTDQIRILKELYYNNGVRSPSAEQIQRISARLRQYGKIEGKNVFYWFQNHKARERQKKRFTNANPITSSTTSSAWKPEEYHLFHHVKYSNLSPPVVPSSSSSPANVVGVNGNYQYGYRGVTNNIMDKAFRDGSAPQNFGWVGSSDPHSSTYDLIDKRSYINVEDDDQDDYHDHGDQASPAIETLPLFPMRDEDCDGYNNVMMKPNFSDSGAGGYYGHVSSRASLELSLNSYGYNSL